MKRVAISVLFLSMSFYTKGQELFNKYYPELVKESKTTNIIHPRSFIDSLKVAILLDTVRFSRRDLSNSSLGTRNKHPYSLLFIVDRKYSYLLDIISGSYVLQFCKKFLNDSVIDEISLIGREDATAIYGNIGRMGAITITTKSRSGKLNYKVAGLVLKNGTGDNFDQYQRGDFKISY